MSETNGRLLSPTPTPKHEALSERDSAGLTNLRNLRQLERLGFGLMLCVLLTLCAGCGTLSTPPSEGATNPKPPQLREPLPSESYLQQAQKLIESWRNAVTGM